MKEEAESLKWDLASFSCIPIQSAPPAKLVVLIFSCADLSDDNDLKYNISTSAMPVERVILQ